MSTSQPRRKFLKQIGIGAAAITAAPALPSTQENRTKSPFEFSTPPYLQHLTEDRVTIMILTSSNSYTAVEYDDGKTKRTAHNSEDGLILANTTLHKICLTDLQPDTTYRYRMLSKEIVSFEPYKLVYGEEIRSEVFTFKTAKTAPQSISFVILNDIHDRPESFSALLNNVDLKEVDFVSLNGDMFDYQTDETQIINHLLLPLGSILHGATPFIMNRGNHETRGKYARAFKTYFDLPEQRFYHAQRYGDTFVIHLDTGEDKKDDHEVYAGIVDFDGYRREQGAWLERLVSTEEFKTATFKVVVMHIPPFHSGEWHGPMHCRAVFADIFERAGIDAVISGHTHRMGLHPADTDHSYPVIIGGGPKDGQRTLITVKSDAKSLHIRLIGEDARLVDEISLSKKKR